MKDALVHARIELLHIQLELQHGRAHHLRHFIDQFYCYKHGYTNRSGKADWDRLLWSEYVSKAAMLTRNKADVTKEHVVPLKLIGRKLLEKAQQSPISLREIEDIIDCFLVFATITREEDAHLRRLKLGSAMPEAFFDEASTLHGDVFARYKVAGIELFNAASFNAGAALTPFTPLAATASAHEFVTPEEAEKVRSCVVSG